MALAKEAQPLAALSAPHPAGPSPGLCFQLCPGYLLTGRQVWGGSQGGESPPEHGPTHTLRKHTP